MRAERVLGDTHQAEAIGGDGLSNERGHAGGGITMGGSATVVNGERGLSGIEEGLKRIEVELLCELNVKLK
jgi:hypothetical protein